MAKLVFIKPRSILQLVVTGFVLVSGVLLVALTIAIQQLDLISQQSQVAVSRSISAMGAGRMLLEQCAAMERNARQYAIVGEKNILAVYEERRSSFLEATETLQSLRLSPELLTQLSRIRRVEADAHAALVTGDFDNLENSFDAVLQVAATISANISRWANLQIDSIENEASESKRLITIQLLFLIAAAISLALVFVLLITRPLKQVRTAINQLGSGSYGQDIEVGGPRDLVAIGQQLNWLRERLSHLEQQRTLFLRHVSHELKSPLATIQESASLLGDGVVGELSGEQRELIEIQSKSLQKLHALIDELLRQHERNYADVSEYTQDIRLDRLIRHILAEHDYSIGTSQIKVGLNLGKCRIRGNREQLRALLDNIIANAIRFSPQGGELNIDLHREQDNLVIRVKDQGPGIAAADRQRIFEAFFQGHHQPDHVFKGSGLGLAIAREYASAHDGSIEVVTDDSPGACFQIELPVISRRSTGDSLTTIEPV
ncbi:MAG: ATP-binding protein [Gammaproteobacteria bacterium]|nr:HAMP domain-containing protein [Pseudomonadales bacterium]MCP5347411.1 HAMP domain-containing protein [Pseudomonadales bacterium]